MRFHEIRLCGRNQQVSICMPIWLLFESALAPTVRILSQGHKKSPTAGKSRQWRFLQLESARAVHMTVARNGLKHRVLRTCTIDSHASKEEEELLAVAAGTGIPNSKWPWQLHCALQASLPAQRRHLATGCLPTALQFGYQPNFRTRNLTATGRPSVYRCAARQLRGLLGSHTTGSRAFMQPRGKTCRTFPCGKTCRTCGGSSSPRVPVVSSGVRANTTLCKRAHGAIPGRCGLSWPTLWRLVNSSPRGPVNSSTSFTSPRRENSSSK